MLLSSNKQNLERRRRGEAFETGRKKDELLIVKSHFTHLTGLHLINSILAVIFTVVLAAGHSYSIDVTNDFNST